MIATETIHAWVNAGMTVLPVTPTAKKHPGYGDIKMAWKKYVTQKPTQTELEQWFQPGRTDGIGAITGAPSGDLELFEFEGRAAGLVTPFSTALISEGGETLWAKIFKNGYVELSPSGGIHILYRVDGGTLPSVALASRPATEAELADNPKDKARVLIETRGEGGFVVLAPSAGRTHETGKAWQCIVGTPDTIPTISATERDLIHQVARTFDQTPARTAKTPPTTPTPSNAPGAGLDIEGGHTSQEREDQPGTDYARRTEWTAILEPEGWTFSHGPDHDGRTYWTRPGKDAREGASASVWPDGNLYVFSSSTELPTNEPLSKFFLYTHYHHDGDWKAGTKALRAQGYGTPLPPRQQTRTSTRTVEDTRDPHANPERTHRGHARMAYRLAAANKHRLMYVRGLGWHIWDGKRWAEDEKDTAKNAVLEVLRDALAESLEDTDLRTDVRKCESAAGVAGVLDLAAALPALRASITELDPDPHLINCANGTLDLRTRTLRPHDPADRMTSLCRGAYDPNSDRRAWDDFLTRVLPDPEERAYLQRVIGQSMFGLVREHLFPVLTGTGQNGKGTAYGAISHALGDYATIINPDLLMASRNSTGGPEMMTLRGARLVVGSETEDGRQIDAATMKRLTGGDELTARRLYQEPVKWHPTHQLVYVTNHLPKVKGNDPAVWRRIRVIPFDVVVPEEERDPELPERLELSADAILTWAAEGWFAYVDMGGMHEPASVLKATDDYQTSSDAVKRFIQDECSTGAIHNVRARQLHTAWSQWAATDGAEPLGEKAFAKELDRLGYESTKNSSGAFRKGLALRPQIDDSDEQK